MNKSNNKRKVKITCISDTHTKTNDLVLPEGDILIHCGDFTRFGRKKEIDKFNEFIKNQKFSHKIVIAGNHDIVFDNDNYSFLTEKYRQHFKNNDLVSSEEAKALLKDCVYLENSGVKIMNINFWGYPVSDTGGQDGAFYYDSDRHAENIKKYLDKVPDNIDIFISHGPPFGILDKIVDGTSVGCKILKDYVFTKIKPKYHVFGHIHESNGIAKETIGDKEICFINAAVCDVEYKPVNEINSFEYENDNC